MAERVKQADLPPVESERIEFEARLASKPARLLETVSAFLNGLGGDILIGIAETDGRRSSTPGLTNADAQRERLVDILADRIEPRPQGIEVAVLSLQDGPELIRVQVPSAGDELHAVRDGANLAWYQRIDSRNRPMHPTDVRARLCAAGASEADSHERARRKLSDGRRTFLRKRARGPALRLALAPLAGEVELSDEAIGEAVQWPELTGSRRVGFTWRSDTPLVESGESLTVGKDDGPWRRLELARDRSLVFESIEDPSWSWHAVAARSEGVVIDPYLVTELPCSLMRLASWIANRAGSDRHGGYLAEVCFRGVAGARLGPGDPRSLIFRHVDSWHRHGRDELCVAPGAPLEITEQELRQEPDRVAFRLARGVYEAFGYDEDDVPFFTRAAGRFDFGT